MKLDLIEQSVEIQGAIDGYSLIQKPLHSETNHLLTNRAVNMQA